MPRLGAFVKRDARENSVYFLVSLAIHHRKTLTQTRMKESSGGVPASGRMVIVI